MRRSARKCVMPSGARRSGGQGDLLAGAMGTFLAWASIATKSNPLLIDSSDSLTLDCALAACMLVKTVSLRAFEKQGRSVAVPDMIPEISRAFEYLFEGVDGMQENEEDE